MLRLVFLDVFYGDRERDRCVFRRRIKFDHLPSFSGGEIPIALFVLFDHVITLAVDLRDTTVAFESDSFLEVLSWSLFERAKRTAVPCSIFRKVLLSKRMPQS